MANCYYNDSARKGKVSGWQNIVAVNTNLYNSIGLKSDGTVVAVGENKAGECDVGHFQNIGPVDKVEIKRANERKAEQLRITEQRRKEEEQRRVEEQRKAWQSQGRCLTCGGQFGGVFSKKCNSCGRAQG